MGRTDPVLVVDDDPPMLRSIARLLRLHGYASVLFPSAKAFAEHGDFDRALCVLLDINLGDASGIELSNRLKGAGNSVPVIFMTGNRSSLSNTFNIEGRDSSARIGRATETALWRTGPPHQEYVGSCRWHRSANVTRC
jgi:DNA-binding response OmpR family regulator